MQHSSGKFSSFLLAFFYFFHFRILNNQEHISRENNFSFFYMAKISFILHKYTDTHSGYFLSISLSLYIIFFRTLILAALICTIILLSPLCFTHLSYSLRTLRFFFAYFLISFNSTNLILIF